MCSSDLAKNLGGRLENGEWKFADEKSRRTFERHLQNVENNFDSVKYSIANSAKNFVNDKAEELKNKLAAWAETFNDPEYFREDPIVFPTYFRAGMKAGRCSLKDVEVAAVFASHFAWGRRSMIVRDCRRLFDRMNWRPYDFVMEDRCPRCPDSIHRTVKWSEVADICDRLRRWYGQHDTLEGLSAEEMRVMVYGRKSDAKAPNKKINLMRRWMVRNDGMVDLGLWKDFIDRRSLIIPMDTHVLQQSVRLGLLNSKTATMSTARRLSAALMEIFPDDPMKGDFALFGYGVNAQK